MFEAQLNLFDICVISVIALSMLLSFFRGFLREVLALAGWFGASAAAVYFFPVVAEWIRPYMGSDTAASVAAAIGVFILALLVISLINATILRFVRVGADTGFLDNALGLFFGLARGAFIVSLGFLLLSLIFNKNYYPDWLEEAQTRPYAERGAEWLAGLAPAYLSEDSKLGAKLSKIGEKAADERPKEGYKERDAEELNRLVGSGSE